MILNLSIQGYISLGKDDGNLKMDAIHGVMNFLRVAANYVGDDLGSVDLNIMMDTANVPTGTVLFHVERKSSESASFYYNVSHNSGTPDFISMEKRGIPLRPVEFFNRAVCLKVRV